MICKCPKLKIVQGPLWDFTAVMLRSEKKKSSSSSQEWAFKLIEGLVQHIGVPINSTRSILVCCKAIYTITSSMAKQGGIEVLLLKGISLIWQISDALTLVSYVDGFVEIDDKIRGISTKDFFLVPIRVSVCGSGVSEFLWPSSGELLWPLNYRIAGKAILPEKLTLELCKMLCDQVVDPSVAVRLSSIKSLATILTHGKIRLPETIVDDIFDSIQTKRLDSFKKFSYRIRSSENMSGCELDEAIRRLEAWDDTLSFCVNTVSECDFIQPSRKNLLVLNEKVLKGLADHESEIVNELEILACIFKCGGSCQPKCPLCDSPSKSNQAMTANQAGLEIEGLGPRLLSLLMNWRTTGKQQQQQQCFSAMARTLRWMLEAIRLRPESDSTEMKYLNGFLVSACRISSNPILKKFNSVSEMVCEAISQFVHIVACDIGGEFSPPLDCILADELWNETLQNVIISLICGVFGISLPPKQSMITMSFSRSREADETMTRQIWQKSITSLQNLTPSIFDTEKWTMEEKFLQSNLPDCRNGTGLRINNSTKSVQVLSSFLCSSRFIRFIVTQQGLEAKFLSNIIEPAIRSLRKHEAAPSLTTFAKQTSITFLIRYHK